jgi:hypothetical protein
MLNNQMVPLKVNKKYVQLKFTIQSTNRNKPYSCWISENSKNSAMFTWGCPYTQLGS